jgi:hypothetical protein
MDDSSYHSASSYSEAEHRNESYHWISGLAEAKAADNIQSPEILPESPKRSGGRPCLLWPTPIGWSFAREPHPLCGTAWSRPGTTVSFVRRSIPNVSGPRSERRIDPRPGNRSGSARERSVCCWSARFARERDSTTWFTHLRPYPQKPPHG